MANRSEATMHLSEPADDELGQRLALAYAIILAAAERVQREREAEEAATRQERDAQPA
jgi:hypothetical protein